MPMNKHKYPLSNLSISFENSDGSLSPELERKLEEISEKIESIASEFADKNQISVRVENS